MNNFKQSFLGLLSLLMFIAGASLAGTAAAQSATVNGITISDVSVPQAQRGVQYSFDLNTRTSGSVAPYTYSLLTQTLPNGIVLGSNGVISGVNCDSKNGSFPFSVRVTSSTGVVADFTGGDDLSINMTAGPGGACDLAIVSTGGSATWPVNTPYSDTLTASGPANVGPNTFAVINGSLPPGLSLSSSGAITGTPTTVGTYVFTVQALDSSVAGLGGVGTFTIEITNVTIAIGPASLTGGTSGTAYSQLLTPTGGTGPYTCSITAGALPAGISLTSNTLTGTPTSAGSYNFTVTC
ncbi:MAG: putative Ig domain-containing protein, partial [Arenimonas sp.]